MRDRLQIGALCWVLTGQFFLAQFLAQAAFPDYSLVRYDISLLGATSCGFFPEPSSGATGELCSPRHAVFNLGLVLHGLLSILGAWFTRAYWPGGREASLGLACLAVGGAGAVLAGAFPFNVAITPHIIGAVMALGLPGVGLILLARVLWVRHPVFARFTVLTGTTILLGAIGHALGGGPFGRGTVERLAAWPQTIWYMATGVLLAAGYLQEGRRKLVLGHFT